MKAQDYNSHVALLATNNTVEIVWKAGTAARSWRKSRRVRLSPIKSAVTYAVALHEIGHVAGRQRGTRIDREVQAWEWAKANALEWRKAMKRAAARRLLSYVQWAERRNGVIKPSPSHPIFAWIEKGKQ